MAQISLWVAVKMSKVIRFWMTTFLFWSTSSVRRARAWWVLLRAQAVCLASTVTCVSTSMELTGGLRIAKG